MSLRGFRRSVGLCLLLLSLGTALPAQDTDESAAPPVDQDPAFTEPGPSETESAEPEVDAEEPATEGLVEAPATAESAATSGTLTEVQEGGPPGVPSVAAPDAVGAGGAFTHRVKIDMPAFRDLPLQVSLAYNSSDTFRGGVDNLIAFGWSLNGWSMIERKSIRGGVPTYDDGQDVYVLDGQELMACAGSGATNPWTLRYPLRYITDRVSASCSAGGNLVSRVEDFNRIVYSAANNSFTVTRPNGVKLTYTSVGTLAGDTSAAGTPERTYATKARWLLTRIEDTQATPNAVTYTYDFATLADGYAHRPTEVAFGGYRLRFGYLSYPAAAVPKFATGTPIAGRQPYQLRSIRVYDVNTPIRAYQLVFGTPSALTQTQLLRKVQQYGSNFVYTAPEITGGTALPATEFGYSADTVAFETRTYTGIEFHEASTVADTTRDGIEELVLGARALYSSTPKPNGTGFNYTAYTLPSGRYSFNRLRALISLPALDADCTDVQEVSPSSSGNEHVYARVRSATDILPGYRSSTNVYCMSRWKDFVVSGANGNYENQFDVLKSYLSDTVINSTPLGTLSWNMTSGNANWPKFLKGNYDLDPEMEIIANGKIYNVTSGQLDAGTTYSGGSGITSGTWLYSDFTGDGVDDILVGVPTEGMDSFSPGHYPPSRAYIRVRPEAGYVNGTNTPWASFTSLPISANTFIDPGIAFGWFVGFGDFDADGLTDVAYYDPNGSGADRLSVTRSTGAGFLERTFYTLPSGINYSSLESSRSTVTDINADGLVDVILHEGFTEPQTYDETLPRYTSQESLPSGFGEELCGRRDDGCLCAVV